MHEPDRWSRADALFDAALDRPPAERARWLAEACPDPELRAEVLRLLALADQDDDRLRPQGAFAGPLWEEVARELGASEASARLSAGDAIGPYRIEGVLGRGGAGTVYRAWDPKLERPVAVKALSASFTDGGADLRRFEREARILASLNHPNVASIYELLWVSDRPYLVLELVEGETLGARLARGPLPLREALQVATQLAAALEEAHRNGVIHRDLKPSNAMLSASGRVKVLDFGLAKAAAPSGDARSEETTADGALLGTPAYMSPEQARGEEVDRRTDVWALGCLVYEMLTGRRAFAGHTISEAIAAVLRDDVDWSRLPRGTPQELRRLLRRCLRKDVADRLQDVGDARIELAELAQEGGERAAPPRSRRFAVRALLALGLFGLAFALARGLPSGGGAPTTIRASLPLGPDVRLWLGASHTLALSPDGARLAFVGESDGRTQLYVRELAKDASQPVRNSADARAPFFSPDGRFIGFFAQGELRKVAVSGGVPERIAAAGIEPRGASWSEDGRIAFAQVGAPGLYVVPSRGGEPALLSTLDAASGELEHLWPEWLPGSGALLLSVRVRAPGGSAEELAVLAPRAQRPRRLRPGAQPAYARSGHVVYTRAGGLEAVPFDVRRLETSGTSVAVLESLNAYPQGAASFALSASGSFVYLPPVVATTLAWVGPDGSATPADAPPGTPGWPRLAPDGRRAAVHVGRPASREVWLIDVERPNAYRQLTFGGGGFPVWSPDGRRVAFFSRREGAPSLYVVDADGDGPPRRLLSAKGTTIPASWSGQGRLAFYEIAESTQRDIWVVDVDGDGVATPVVASPANELAPAFSPDGRALAYVSNETGRNEVYVRSYPGPGPVSAVSTDGGIEPVWSRDGSQLLYRHADELRSVPVRTTPRLSLGAARRLLRAEMVTNAAGNPGFDVKPDGSGYLMLRPVAGASTEEVRLLLNWVDELGQQSRAGR